MIRQSSFVSTLLVVLAVFGWFLGAFLGIYPSFLVTSQLGIALHGNYEYFTFNAPVIGAVIWVLIMSACGALGAALPLAVRARLRKSQASAG